MKTTAYNCLALCCATALLGACTSTPLPVKDKPLLIAPATQPATLTTTTTESKVTTVTVPAHLDPSSAIARDRTVYFDFDDYAVKDNYAALIERHSKYLATAPALAIRVAGSADERGSSEYNLALGQKRAEAVARAMRVYGTKDAQVEAVSWGKEKPAALGHDEAAWAQNRRAELDYPTQ